MFGWIKKLFGSEKEVKEETLVLTSEQKVAQPVEFHVDRAAKTEAKEPKKTPAKAKTKKAPAKSKAKKVEVDFESMTKVQIDEYAGEHGIKLDRRKKKQTMIEELKTQLKEK